MKKLQFSTLILVAVLMAATSSKCTQSPTSPSVPTDSVDSVSTALTFDSIEYHHANADSSLRCNIIVDCPQGNDSLSVSILRFISDELASINILNTVNDDAALKGVYQGDINDAKAMVEFYGKQGTSLLKQTLNDLYEVAPREENKFNVCYEAKVRLEEENDKYITFNSMSYAFTGGAHGSTLKHVTNIVKATGKPLEETIDSTQVKALQPILKKGIVSYFKKYDEEVTEKNVLSRLFIENNIIPLPASAPYLANDGVHFVYGQYEIAPYAAGIIEFVVDYNTIKPFLVQEALQCIE